MLGDHNMNPVRRISLMVCPTSWQQPLLATWLWTLLFFSLLWSCSSPLPPADPDNGGLILPDGFEALVVVDSVDGLVRELAVSDQGFIYAKTQNSANGNIAALLDNNQDGKADALEYFGGKDDGRGNSLQTGSEIYNGYLYYSTSLTVYRIKLNPSTLVPEGEPEIVVSDDHEHGSHEHVAKPFAFDNQGYLYVPFGAPSNACQENRRTPGVPGIDPCPQLEDHGGIWRFDAEKLNQTQSDGMKYATGMRSIVAMDWNQEDQALYAVIHGRDDLFRLFPELFNPWQSALLPSEEFVKVTEGSDFGWPYCYYDQMAGKKVLAPEYGGDGIEVGRCSQYDLPLIGFPGHWAPNGLYFYRGDQFPDRYRNGAFIAFHGSTNRAPYPQSGYIVAFVPFVDGKLSSEWELFADGFAQVDPIVSTKDAAYRPMGIAMGPDGSLYLSETNKGKIWRVMFKGDKEQFGAPQLAGMESRKSQTHIRTPDQVNDKIEEEFKGKGQELYGWYCGACHQGDGKGDGGRFPPLAGAEWVTGDEERLIGIVLNGLQGPIEINGVAYNGVMPQHSYLTDEQIADILTYIRSSFGNQAGAITPQQVNRVRDSS